MDRDHPTASSFTASIASSSVPAHDAQHITLSDPTWAIWRWSVLRGAGFAANLPLQLADPACAIAADILNQSELAVQAARSQVESLLAAQMEAEPEKRIVFANILQSLAKGKMPKAGDLPAPVQEALATLRTARAAHEQAQAVFQQAFAAAMVTTTTNLRELVQMDHFQQALAWQNRQVLHTCVEHFLSKPVTTTNSQYRQHRSLLARYIQRYALKNDTIGYFGPVGWTHWEPEARPMQVQPGANLLAQRTVYIEGWGINALSQALAADAALRPYAIPRLMPFARVTPTTLHLPFVKPLPLTPAQAHVLAACDGTRTARQLAREMLRAGVPGLATEGDVFALLEKMTTTRRISWSFDVPPEDPFPEKALRRNLAGIEDADLRARALASLAALEGAVDDVRHATSNTAALDHAISRVETVFTELTAQEPTRSSGQLYAGRTLLYEDCRRDVTITMGTEILQKLERPLALLLTSARWLSYQLAQHTRVAFRAIYDEMARKQGSSVVEFNQFFPWVNTELFDPGLSSAPFLEPVQAEFQRKWAAILNLPTEQRRVECTYDAVAARVAQAFDAPGPGWPLAIYHCPDLMIHAASVEAINRGDFQFVMGELHQGINTLDAAIFVQQHPHMADLYQAIGEDVPQPRIVPLFNNQYLPGSRIQQNLALPKDYRLATAPDVCDAPLEKTLRMSDLVVEESAGNLWVRTRDGRLRFDILEVFSEFLSPTLGDFFSMMTPQAHAPRITLDGLVITREKWRIQAQNVGFATSPDSAASFADARQWAREWGMPRFLFFRTPKEKKPCFLDFDSPLYVEIFVKELRRMLQDDPGEEVIASLSEMIPSPDHAWLMDAQGAQYTSEIRIVAVDQKGKRG